MWHMSDRRCVEGLVVNPDGQSAWKMGVDGRIMVMRLTEKRIERAWTGYIWLRIRESGGLV
jgi:hypothetical protein